MLTVKWVLKRTEGEITRIFDAHSVAVAYPDASVVTDSNVAGGAAESRGTWLQVLYALGPDGTILLGKRDACLLIDPDDERTAKRLAEGTCYVMNDTGRTIGTYRLDDVDVNGDEKQVGIRSSRVNTDQATQR
jgi:hypothetical protein